MQTAMLSKLHPEMAGLLAGSNMLTSDSKMEENIGRTIKFLNWNKLMGTNKRDYSYIIVGIQLTYDRRKAYRVLCNGYMDNVGCLALPDEFEFI